MTAWMVEEYIEDFLWLSSQLQNALGKFSKQAARNVGPLLESVVVTGAGFDGERYVLEVEYVLIEPWRIKTFLAQARLPVSHDTTNVTVSWQHAESSQTFALKDAHESRTATLRLPGKWLRVEGEIRIGSIPVRTYFEIPEGIWVEMSQHANALYALGLVNKAESLRKRAEDELRALLRLWDDWLDDKRPTCELAPEIQARYQAYVVAASEWKKAFLEARDFIHRTMPDVRPPKDVVGLPEVLPPERWPERRKLQATIETLASQAETIAQSIAPVVTDLTEKYSSVKLQIEATAKEAAADIAALRMRGAPQEEIDAVKARAKAKIAELKRAFAREAEATMRQLKTALKQVQDLAERAKYLTCHGAQPQEYIVKPKVEVMPTAPTEPAAPATAPAGPPAAPPTPTAPPPQPPPPTPPLPAGAPRRIEVVMV
jgi:hypothetical protein